MAIEIRELKIKGFINKKTETSSNTITPELLRSIKKDILRDCKSEIIRHLAKQKRR